MGLGDSVAALLDTYSKCLELLRSLKGRRSDGAGASDSRSEHSLLRKSIKSDRGKVYRTYSSRLSEAGSRFEKGDDRSRSALRRILHRLKATIARLLNIGQAHDAASMLDYRSLMTLSNTSRSEAVRTMDQLSQRLSTGASPRGNSVKSPSSSKSSKSKGDRQVSDNKKHARSSSKASSVPSATKSAQYRGANETRYKASTLSHEKPKKPRDRPESSRSELSIGKLQKPADRKGHGTNRHEGPRSPGVQHRISMISASTDSTKLGEIPERKWRRENPYDARSDRYNVRPTYPLRRYQQPEPKPRTFFGLFKR